MRHLDLFSGIGGFALAASWVWGEDHEIVSFCEIEPYPQKVLAKHWPDVPCHGDIKTLKGDSFGTVDLITGGFPCQPFSTAGKQGGSSDDRHLWPEMFRVIQEAKPSWVIGENVAGLVNMVEFEQCFLDLESEGYETQAFIIPAFGVGARHCRNRVWIIAYSNKIGQQGKLGQLLATPEKRERLPKARFARPQWRHDKATPRIFRRVDGLSRGVDRVEGLGNAIVPQCVVPIMQAIKQISMF